MTRTPTRRSTLPRNSPAAVVRPETSGRAVLDADGFNLRAGLAAVIEYAAKHSDRAATTAGLLGLADEQELAAVAARHGVKLSFAKRGGTR